MPTKNLALIKKNDYEDKHKLQKEIHELVKNSIVGI
jgi:hypothetical protein